MKPLVTKLGAGALAAGLLLSACGGSSAPTAAPTTEMATSGNTTTSAASPTPADQGQGQGQGNTGNNDQAEFGLAEEEVAIRVEAVESAVATCMSAAGFDYVAVDYATSRMAMDSNSKPSGLSGAEFVAQYGYGISTLAVGAGTQGESGLSSTNTQIRDSLAATDRIAWERALLGENTSQTFVVGLDGEDFSGLGGCTAAAVGDAFPDQDINAQFASYQDAQGGRVDQDARVIEAYQLWSGCMRDAGHSYNNPNETETDIAGRLDAILGGQDVSLLDAAATTALKDLQGEEVSAAAADNACSAEFVDAVKTAVETELFGPGQ